MISTACHSTGVTYNSFLIMDEKICLIDGVKAPFAGEQLSNIRTIVDPEKSTTL